MRVTRFRSINGWTYVLSVGLCVLGYFRSRAAAEAALAERTSHNPPDVAAHGAAPEHRGGEAGDEVEADGGGLEGVGPV
jgi:hypothetical protein